MKVKGFLNSLKEMISFVRNNWISVLIIAVCAILVIAMAVSMFPEGKEGKSPVEDVRFSVYEKGIEVCKELSTNDTMVEIARIYASGSDINASMYFLKMQELEKMCETAPEEVFFSAISAVVGLNLDAASLYADHEYGLSSEYQQKAEQLFEDLKLATTLEELDAIIKKANAFGD